jgi:hypothetical protein
MHFELEVRTSKFVSTASSSKPDRVSKQQQRQNHQREPERHRLLIGRELEPAVFGSFGRMAIRFSCCASQFMVLRNRSPLPWKLRSPFDAKSLSPIATNRDSGLGASGPSAAGPLAAGADAAAPMLTGPFLSPLSRFFSGRPVA